MASHGQLIIHHPTYPLELMYLQLKAIAELLESIKESVLPDKISQIIGHKSKIETYFQSLYSLFAWEFFFVYKVRLLHTLLLSTWHFWHKRLLFPPKMSIQLLEGFTE